MSLESIDHIGIAVEDLEQSIKIYSDLFGKIPDDLCVLESEKVKIAFFDVGSSSVELLQATSEDSPIAKYIAKKGPGIHHICYRVENLEYSMKDLVSKGYRCIDSIPRSGAHNTKVCFFHPKDFGGVLVELSQKRTV
tara:strand:- start:128 stop:538 length:411 start_codon:yes stop_codon:yes gene_type:complete